MKYAVHRARVTGNVYSLCNLGYKNWGMYRLYRKEIVLSVRSSICNQQGDQELHATGSNVKTV